ncbi:unnamed protein product [Diamesa serratosioi]
MIFLLSFVVVAAIKKKNLFPGDVCLTKDNETGICTGIYECEYVKELKERKGSQFDFKLDLFQCGFSTANGKIPVICCKIESRIDEDNRMSTVACEKFKEIKSKLSLQITDHIIGGTNANVGEIPHMAAIAYNDFETNSIQFNCGGSLISRRFVLTAEHCVNTKNSPIFVRLGKTSLNDEDELTALDINVKKIHHHNDYRTTIKHNDIALLELERIIADNEFSHTLMPACLYFGAKLQNELIISGWGINGSEKQTKTNWLQKAKVTELTFDECKNNYVEFKIEFVKTQMCALNVVKTADTCPGDSGGPIQSFKDGQYYVVGITSFGAGCGSPLPGIYTKVSSFIDWIEERVWPN